MDGAVLAGCLLLYNLLTLTFDRTNQCASQLSVQLMTNLGYVTAPVIAYVCAGSLKFAINSMRVRNLAFSQIGLGGMPSTHTTIVSSVLALVGFREGIASPSFGIALALTMIVIVDALDLRRKVGRHATVLRRLVPTDLDERHLRERMGHNPLEVGGGLILGTLIGAVLASW